MANATNSRYPYASERSLGKNKVPQKEAKEAQTLGKIIHEIIRERDGYMFREKKGGGTRRTPADMAQCCSRANVASRLGINESMLRKKLYHYDTSREWIIAICAAYGLNAKQTSEALNKYDYGGLDLEADREEAIEDLLDAYAEQHKLLSLEDLNQMLTNGGFAPINIQKRGKAEKPGDGDRAPHFAFKSEILVEAFGLEGTPYNSLETDYLPTSRCIASSLISDPAGRTYELKVDQDGKAFAITEKGTVDCVPIDHPDFGRFIPTLQAEAKRKKQWYDDIIHDSRNYKGRFSANLKEHALHAFYEEYNYGCPERHEYFLMEYWKGQYTLSVSQESMFMREYLSGEEYAKYYRRRDTAERITYASADEIEFENTKKAYRKLQSLVAGKVAEIQNRKLHIRNIDMIRDNPREVLRYYEIEDVFHCEYEPEFGEISNALDTVTVEPGTEREVTVTLDDVRTGFACGFDTFEEICEYLRSHKSPAEALQ